MITEFFKFGRKEKEYKYKLGDLYTDKIYYVVVFENTSKNNVKCYHFTFGIISHYDMEQYKYPVELNDMPKYELRAAYDRLIKVYNYSKRKYYDSTIGFYNIIQKWLDKMPELEFGEEVDKYNL